MHRYRFVPAVLLLILPLTSCTHAGVPMVQTPTPVAKIQPAPLATLAGVGVMPLVSHRPVAAPRAQQYHHDVLRQNAVAPGPAPTAAMADSKGAYSHGDVPYEEKAAPVALPESAFQQVATAPLSTFSADVDTGSYTNVRRQLSGGTVPSPEDVRIEEFINYFTYAYPEPTGKDPVSITTELSTAPWAPEHQLVRIGLKARSIDRENLPPNNLVFLLDVSGSMEPPERLPLIKGAMKRLVSQLRSIDRVAIVTYAGEAGLVLPSTPGNHRDRILGAIESLEAGGSTNGAAGITMAYQVAQDSFIKGGNNRVILGTDGDFNVGVTDDNSLEKIIAKKRETGVFLSCLGVGDDNLKDKKMEILADKGNGNYNYIDNSAEAEKVLVHQMGATLVTVAKDVKLQVAFNRDRVKSYRLIGYEKRHLETQDFANDTKDAGDMGAGHTVTALYEIVPNEDPGNGNLLKVSVRYKQPDSNTSELMERSIDNTSVALQKSSDDFRFACAAAEFAMLLRDSPYKGASSYSQVAQLSSQARGEDLDGCRAEFSRLTDTRAALAPSGSLVR